MDKQLLGLLLERFMRDEELRREVAAMDETEFTSLLRENGGKDIQPEECTVLLAILKGYMNEEGELSEEALDKIAGGFCACLPIIPC